MITDIHIDWLQFTSDRPANAYINEGVPDSQNSPVRFYQKMRLYDSGAQEHAGNPNSNRYLIILPGAVCKHHQIDHLFCQHLIADDCNISRLDIAITTDQKILDKFWRSQKKIDSKLWNGMKMIVDTKKHIETIYVGDGKKRGRKGIVRAYDKALELALPDTIMHRIEIEMKRKHAQISTRRIAAGDSLASVANSKFRIKEKWYETLLSNAVSTRRFADEKEDGLTDIEKKMLWLERQVLPSLRYVHEYDKANGTTNLLNLLSKIAP